MNMYGWSKRVLGTGSMLLAAALILSLLLDGSNGWGGSDLFTALALLLVFGGMFYLWQMQNISEKAVEQRIKAEFPSDLQPQIYEVYRRLRRRELEGLFLKILDDAKGDFNKVKNLASVAENVGWKAFLENKW